MLHDHWYIACPSLLLGDHPLAVTVCGEPLAVFRSVDGEPRALQDRCCHRGMPLSRGRVVDGRIQCRFHGWTYDGGGACVAIPSQPADIGIAGTFRVRAFPCCERDGYVWVWPGSAAPGPEPRIEGFAAGRWIQGSRRVACDYGRALEITFDTSHVYHAHATHPATVVARRSGFGPTYSSLSLTATGCLVVTPPLHAEGESIPDSATVMEFLLPGRIRFHWPTPSGAYVINFFVIPAEADHCRLEYMVANVSPDAPTVLWSPKSFAILDEDVDILETTQAVYAREGAEFERSVEADQATLLLRRIVRLAARGEWRGLATDLPHHRMVCTMGAQSLGFTYDMV